MNAFILTTLTVGLLLGVATPADGADPRPFGPESRVWFTGASNLRSFTCRAGELEGGLELPSGASVLDVLRGEAAAGAATLTIPVEGLDCGIALQTRHLHETLKAEAAPAIEFRLADYDVESGEAGAAMRLDGQLTIAGVEKPFTLVGEVFRDDAGALRLKGKREIRVTDFGVEPPRRFLGLLRVRDRVDVHFDIVLEEPAEPEEPEEQPLREEIRLP